MKDSLPYAAMRTVRNILKFDQTYDETGICHVCGLFTWFRYRELFTKDAPLVAYDRDPQKSAIMINLLNTLDCSWCLSKFRVRAAAQEVLKQFEPVSIKNLVGELRLGTRTASILQTGVTGGVFTDAGIPGVTFTEFLPDVPRGEQRGNVRSENLEHLTFADGSFDLVISLDVFEHIYDPWQAFKEVYRVLRPGGCAVITVPMDKEKTETSRRYDSVTRTHLLPALYHLDPLQASGVLVVTDFGLDITTQLANYGIPASLMSYPTKYPECTQFVITIKKSEV